MPAKPVPEDHAVRQGWRKHSEAGTESQREGERQREEVESNIA